VGKKSIFSSEPGERTKTGLGVSHIFASYFSLSNTLFLGIIMSLHLFRVPREQQPSGSSSKLGDELRTLCGYESGEVTLRRYARTDKYTSVEGAGWEVIWNVKLHVESGVF
jgi:hypothetical protein